MEHKLRWKHIYRINSSMRIKKVMWLCAVRRDNLTNQWTDLIHSIYMLLWSSWKAWEKSVIKVFLYNCQIPKQQHPPPNAVTALCYVCSLWGTNNLYYIWKLLYSVAPPIFLVIFSVTVYQEVTVLFSLTRWMETVLYWHMFYAILQFWA